jgi:hypothetical protein
MSSMPGGSLRSTSWLTLRLSSCASSAAALTARAASIWLHCSLLRYATAVALILSSQVDMLYYWFCATCASSVAAQHYAPAPWVQARMERCSLFVVRCRRGLLQPGMLTR